MEKTFLDLCSDILPTNWTQQQNTLKLLWAVDSYHMARGDDYMYRSVNASKIVISYMEMVSICLEQMMFSSNSPVLQLPVQKLQQVGNISFEVLLISSREIVLCKKKGGGNTTEMEF